MSKTIRHELTRAVPENRRRSRRVRNTALTPALREAAVLYGRGMRGRNAMIATGHSKPALAFKEQIGNLQWLRAALAEVRDTKVRFATLDRLARYRLLHLLGDEATPAPVVAQLIKVTFDALKKSRETITDAVAAEDAALTGEERARRMLRESLAEDAEAQRTAVDVEVEEVKKE